MRGRLFCFLTHNSHKMPFPFITNPVVWIVHIFRRKKSPRNVAFYKCTTLLMYIRLLERDLKWLYKKRCHQKHLTLSHKLVDICIIYHVTTTRKPFSQNITLKITHRITNFYRLIFVIFAAVFSNRNVRFPTPPSSKKRMLRLITPSNFS